MSKDQSYGFAIFVVSIIVAVVYLAAFFAHYIGLPTEWEKWAVGIPVLLFVLLVLVISGWIGWTMLTTPPPAPLEPEPTPSPQPSAAPAATSKSSTRTRRRRK